MMIVVLLSCKDDDSLSPEEKAAKSIQGTWTVGGGGHVIVDDANHTADYSNFSITFDQTTDGQLLYTVKNGGYAFHNINVDTWSFGDSQYKSIVRGQDQVNMLFSTADEKLTLNFSIADNAGRLKGMFGDFEIVLIKKN
ncbi:hypothetical protein DQQ10_10120 [Pseudochryseolinea flava]|uniref:Lipocalin-like domain-containing protein n=2 Tax=Pseudochryseolinea flava TaxID=2059302 RepID=A0A364Y4Z2_9BACT|nr:hypothetical protein DQQ10_10120 [Pseudochryseolinea flava]